MAAPQFPEQKIIITHGGADTELQGRHVSAIVERRESKGSDATLVALDYEGESFLSQIANDDIIQIFFKDENTAWEQVFEGYVVELTPDTKKGQGELLAYKGYGVDSALDRMRVANEYGDESANAQQAVAFDYDLVPDAWVNVHGDWTHVPTDGLCISASDGDANYISMLVLTANLGKYDEHYTFADLSPTYASATITKAEIYVEAKIVSRTNSAGIRIYVWDGVVWQYGGIINFSSTSYTELLALDATAILNTLAKVNAAKIKIEFAGFGGAEEAGSIYITYVRLHMEGTGYVGPPQTLKNILTNTTNGIVPKYVEKVLATALASGYSLETSYILDDLSVLKYLYFPYTPANDCMRQLLDLLAAAKYPNAGLHWLVVPNGKTTPWLCIDQVGNHTTASAKWPTNAPFNIEIGVNAKDEHYEYKKQEANYVVYFGKYEFPTGDFICENPVAKWVSLATLSPAIALFNDGSDKKVGNHSLQFGAGGVGASEALAYYPSGYNLGIDITKIGTRSTIPQIGLYIKQNNIAYARFLLGTGMPVFNAGNCYEINFYPRLPAAGKWGWVSIPVGPNIKQKEKESEDWSVRWTGTGDTFNWAQVDWIGLDFYFNAVGAYVKVDGLVLQGIVTRGAFNSTHIGSHRATMKLITDSLAKSSNLVASDDSGTVAQLAKAELLRALTTPIVGTVTLDRLWPTAMPGQITHCHGRRIAAGGFHIDKNVRLTEVKHVFAKDGAATTVSFTDDVLNSYPREPTNDYNVIMKAVNPDFQDRDRGDLKGRDIDIFQTILTKDYA
jgi:hypothetical protein